MKIRELNKKELQEVTDLYIKERGNYCDLITIEEFVENHVGRCDNCGKFVVKDDTEDLLEDETWRGEHINVCRECYKEEHKEYEVE